jgi:glycosyltransferase involved in cell wall biosynthesis
MARILAAGTYDPAFARNRRLVALLEHAGHQVDTCQVDVWGDQRYEIPQSRKLKVLLRAVLGYPKLLWRFLRASHADAVLVLYPGSFDMLVLAPLARLRRMPVMFNAFISLYDTVVDDRKLASAGSMLGRVLRIVDRWSVRLADRVLVDTPAHAEYFVELGGIARDKVGVIWIGAQDDVIGPHPEVTPEARRVLFHGTFIALQGLETIVPAAKLLERDDITVRIVGSGQEQATVDRLVAELQPANVELVGTVPLERVPIEIASAAVCLGIFGVTEKAHRVVPNKVFECAAVGRPIVTGDTKGMRSAFDEGQVVLVPTGDPEALARAIRLLIDDPDTRERIGAAGHARYVEAFATEPLSRLLDEELHAVLDGRDRRPS